ncbi:MAG: hypothetical protein M3N07_00220 [Pseudomonadota bacterium]|nr:hypothetical protein [Pseudomonadota bacterium]
MHEEDPEQQRVMALLEPYFHRIHPRFTKGLALYNDEYPPNVRAEHDDRAAASSVWCHIWQDFQREFLDESGFHFLEVRNLRLLNIRDELVIRVKKVDENGRHRNYQTRQQENF